MDDRIPLRTAAELLGVSHRTITSMVRRGELTRIAGVHGWEYRRAEVLELARQRARLYGPPVPGRGRGRPARVHLPHQASVSA